MALARLTATHRSRTLALAALAVAATAALAAAAPALGHQAAPISSPADPSAADPSWLATAWAFSGYGAKHILLGYDHLLFLGGLALLSTKARDVVGIAALFAISYSATLVGGTLAGLAIPGEPIDAVIALSVGFVGAQIAFGSADGRLTDDPRWAALPFGLAHGLGLSALLQELQLPDDELLPSILGFNLGVEVGQLAVLIGFIAVLVLVRRFPFPAYQRIPAGCAFISAAALLLTFLVGGASV